MPRHPKLLSKNELPTKLGDAPEWHPLFLLTTIGNFTWSYVFIRHISWVLLGALVLYESFACFILCFKSSILAGHTYLREPKLCHDLLELLSMLHLIFLWAIGLALVLHLYLFEHGVLSFFKKCSLASLRFIWELVKISRNSLLLHLNYFERKKKNYAHDHHLYLFELMKSNTWKLVSKW